MLQARAAIKKLRNESMANTLKIHHLKKPVLDNMTRWGSSYRMLMYLLSARGLVDTLGTNDLTFKFSQKEWSQIQDCVNALEPVQIATMVLQKEQLFPGDFYATWLRSQLKLEIMTNGFAVTLLESMKKREEKLLDNDTFLAALYLDPRYMPIVFKGDPQENTIQSRAFRAQTHLKKLWFQLKRLEGIDE